MRSRCPAGFGPIDALPTSIHVNSPETGFEEIGPALSPRVSNRQASRHAGQFDVNGLPTEVERFKSSTLVGLQFSSKRCIKKVY